VVAPGIPVGLDERFLYALGTHLPRWVPGTAGLRLIVDRAKDVMTISGSGLSSERAPMGAHSRVGGSVGKKTVVSRCRLPSVVSSCVECFKIAAEISSTRAVRSASVSQSGNWR
jgi:hypothetical protein